MKPSRLTAAITVTAAAAAMATAGTAAAATSHHPPAPASRAVPAAHTPRDTWTAWYTTTSSRVTWGSQRQADGKSLRAGITVA